MDQTVQSEAKQEETISINNPYHRIDEARRRWGYCFNDFYLAREFANAAWYQAENKQAFKQEEIQRLQSIMREAQKAIDDWRNKHP